MPRSSNQPPWSELKQRLARKTLPELLKILRDLHDLSPANRRFLQARLLPADGDIERYRQQLRDAIYPDPFSRRPISVAAAKQVIRQYQRATADPIGTLDLRLTFVEQGTEQAVDLGFGDERYFASLESMLTVALESVRALPVEESHRFLPRIARLRDNASRIGWGYGDFVEDAVVDVLDASAPPPPTAASDARRREPRTLERRPPSPPGPGSSRAG